MLECCEFFIFQSTPCAMSKEGTVPPGDLFPRQILGHTPVRIRPDPGVRLEPWISSVPRARFCPRVRAVPFPGTGLIPFPGQTSSLFRRRPDPISRTEPIPLPGQTCSRFRNRADPVFRNRADPAFRLRPDPLCTVTSTTLVAAAGGNYENMKIYKIMKICEICENMKICENQ